MFETLHELPEEATDWTQWFLKPRLLRWEGKETWAVNLIHACDDGSRNIAGLINKDEVLEGAKAHKPVHPKYECNGCAESAPLQVVGSKVIKQRDLRTADPRIRRREAVLATRRKRANGGL